MKRPICIILFTFVFFCIDSTYAINPEREYIRTPATENWNYQQLDIQTSDGFCLNSWIYEANPETDKNTVLILAYPDAGNMSYFVYHSIILAHAGYTVVTFDYRGFGESQDFEIRKELLYYNEFALDLEAVIALFQRDLQIINLEFGECRWVR
ncbi:hypothetical protein MM239_04930 [Belliella sp. DSM 111904]|uniref:Serine aminopeptidase S33 domain-containing protein n=1 Tax=Belliella filtrata TaxID=2923435 RepID=A0ABS9UYA2_9BACT|nr:hypothetical protein [Belliella filtrata]MCH7408728.1 hypothetical protein [Belliella filtrata]